MGLENTQHGPVDVDELTRLFEAGAIHESTYVWSPQMDSWKPLQESPLAQSDDPDPPPPPPPPPPGAAPTASEPAPQPSSERGISSRSDLDSSRRSANGGAASEVSLEPHTASVVGQLAAMQLRALSDQFFEQELRAHPGLGAEGVEALRGRIAGVRDAALAAWHATLLQQGASSSDE